MLLASDSLTAEHQLDTIKTLVQNTHGFELSGGRDLLEDPDRLFSLIDRLQVRN